MKYSSLSQDKPPLESARHRPRTALVIDDDEFISKSIATQLRGLGVQEVSTSAGDEETVRLLNEAGPFDLIVTDLAMPTFDGLQLTRLISTRQPNAAVLYVSSVGPQLMAAAMSLGKGRGLQVLGSLEKPVGMSDLRNILLNYRSTSKKKAVLNGAVACEVLTAKPKISGEQEMLPLMRILDRLSPITAFQKQLADVKSQALIPGASPRLIEATDQLGVVVHNHCSKLEAQRSGAVRLLDQMATGLEEMSGYMTSETQSRQTAQSENQQLNTRLLSEVTDMNADLLDSADIKRMQEKVRQRLDGIFTGLQEAKRREDERMQEYEQRSGQMKTRIERLEVETQRLQESVVREHQAASLDRLTGVPNRFSYDKHIREEHKRWEENGEPLILAIWDIDQFKLVNDTYGHAAGDKALQAIGREFAQHLRQSDFIARYGGEEFAMTLRGLDQEQAVVLLDRLRHSIEMIGFYVNETRAHLTVSCGMTAFCKGDSPETAFERADAALYQAKNAGRNRVIAKF